MGIMQKETIKYSRAKALVGSIVFVSFMITLAKLVGDLKFNNIHLSNVTDPFLFLVTLGIFIFFIRNIRVSYRYSVVSDEFIIHKLYSSDKSEILESINVSEILYLGKDKRQIDKFKTNKSRRYTCSMLESDNYCCVYEKNDCLYKFYFNPSDNFVYKINALKLKLKKRAV